jgi:cytidylate kinase
MKKRKIVIIRGLTTAGKTTTSHELAKVLPNWMFVDIWKIKEMFEPLGLKERTPLKTISKEAIMNITKGVMNELKVNIILQESSQRAVKQYLKKELKKYNYKVYSFFLDVHVKDAEKRDVQREKPTMSINKRGLSNEEWKKGGATREKEDIIINTSENSIKQVLDKILKSIGEKRRKHPYSHALRKSW